MIDGGDAVAETLRPRTDFRYGDAEIIKVMHLEQYPRHEVKLEAAQENAVRFQARCSHCGVLDQHAVGSRLDKRASGMLQSKSQTGASPGKEQRTKRDKEVKMAEGTATAEAAAIKYCGCGCGAQVARSFLPGHDAKHASKLIDRALAGDNDSMVEINNRGWGSKLAKRQATLAKAANKPAKTSRTVKTGARARNGTVDKEKLAAAVAILDARGIESGKLDAKEVDEILDGRYFGASVAIHVGDEILFTDVNSEVKRQGTILEMDGDKAKVQYNNGTRDYTKMVPVQAISAAETLAAATA